MKNVKVNYVTTVKKYRKRVLFGIPMTGLIRSEWHLAEIGMVIPTNWSQSTFVHIFPNYSPLGFLVADARNIMVQVAVKDNFEWLLFMDHDVLMPTNLLTIMNQYMIENKIPIVGGLYFTKSVPAEPLVYRGRGNGYFGNWKMGQKIWVDGMGLGCHMISVKLLKIMYEDSPEYTLEPGLKVRRVFESPAAVGVDPETGAEFRVHGTEDLPWYSRVIEGMYLKKGGWKDLQRKEYPFLCDTNLFCYHIDENGRKYPMLGEEKKFK